MSDETTDVELDLIEGDDSGDSLTGHDSELSTEGLDLEERQALRRVVVLETEVRVDLAACYRLVDLYGMTDLHLNHISARVPGREDHYLLNPFGMMYVRSSKPIVSTTSVSPSQRAVLLPWKNGSGFFGSGRPSR